jgi:NitT/TauT family transport system substrate-binding protein
MTRTASRAMIRGWRRAGLSPGWAKWVAAILLAVCGATTAVAAPPSTTTGNGPDPRNPVERQRVRVAIGGHSVEALPLYLTAERTAPVQGLEVEMIAASGGPRVALTLAGDSTDIGVASLTTVLNMIEAGQPVKAFFFTASYPVFGWFGRPGVRSWADVRGGTLGIVSPGSFNEFMTRYVVRKQGLEPGRDLYFRALGGSTVRLAAVRAGRVDAAVLSPPDSWSAEELGLVQLASQAVDVVEEWPHTVLVAKERLLRERVDIVRAFLRAYVGAIRLAQTDRETAVQTLLAKLKWERRHAERAYDEAVRRFDERGRLPVRAMPTFWELSIASGEVTAPWPESRFLDRRYIDSFEDWAPR